MWIIMQMMLIVNTDLLILTPSCYLSPILLYKGEVDHRGRQEKATPHKSGDAKPLVWMYFMKPGFFAFSQPRSDNR
jgi:hypothetical protein